MGDHPACAGTVPARGRPWPLAGGHPRMRGDDPTIVVLCGSTEDHPRVHGDRFCRKRAVFSSCLRYAVELRLLTAHPMTAVSWIAPQSSEVVDRRQVANHVPAQ